MKEVKFILSCRTFMKEYKILFIHLSPLPSATKDETDKGVSFDFIRNFEIVISCM